MQEFLGAITWERLLVLWGLFAPPIAWIATRRWERMNQREQWEHEFRRWQEQIAIEDRRQAEERARERTTAIRAAMQDAYTRFLATTAAITAGAELPHRDERKAAVEVSKLDLILSFQQLLLLASNDAAEAAVRLWGSVMDAARSAREGGLSIESRAKIRSARRDFLVEARADIENPEERSSNPGITLKPVLQIGGFHIDDAG